MPSREACSKVGDHPLLVELFLRREIERVNPVQGVVGRIADEALDRGDDLRVRGLAQHREQGFGFAHPQRLLQMGRRENSEVLRIR